MKKMIFVFVLVALSFSCEGKSGVQHETSAPANTTSGSTSETACPAGSGEALATIEGKPVSVTSIFQDKDVPYRTKNELYEAQKNALDDYLFTALVGREAAKKKVTSEEVIKTEIEGRVRKVSDSDIKKFYDELSKGRGGQIPPLEKVSEQIKRKLTQDKSVERKDQYFEELKKKYKVAYTMSRPKIDVTVGENPVKGSPKAPVTIVEFSDFECPFCKRVEPTLDKVMKEYKGRVNLYFRDFPLEFHQKAKPAAHASRCAGEQGKYWEYHRKLYDKQELGDENYLKYATELKLDVDKFKKCNEEQRFEASIKKDLEEGQKLGVTGTPGFFINGVFISGAQPYEKFKSVIDEELKTSKTKGSGNP
jgi:protein-disulfide isomerase